VACLPYSTAGANGTWRSGLSPKSCNVSHQRPAAFQQLRNLVGERRPRHNISERDQIRRPLCLQQARQDRHPTRNLSTFYYDRAAFRYSTLFNLKRVPTPSNRRLLTSFRVGFNRYANTLPDGGFKFSGLDVFSQYHAERPGAPVLTFGPDSQSPQFNIQNLYQAVRNITWNRGNHSMKFGVEYREYIAPLAILRNASAGELYSTTPAQVFLEDIFACITSGRAQHEALSTTTATRRAIYLYAQPIVGRLNPPALNLNLGVLVRIHQPSRRASPAGAETACQNSAQSSQRSPFPPDH